MRKKFRALINVDATVLPKENFLSIRYKLLQNDMLKILMMYGL